MKKKGIFGMALVNVFSIIVLITILLVFYLLFGMPNVVSEEKIKSLQVDEGNFFLINYLRSPVDVNGERMEMADLIVKYIEDKNLYDDLEENTKRIFESNFPENMCFRGSILLRLMPENKEIKGIRTKPKRLGGTEMDYKVSTVIPLFEDPSKYVEVTLSVEC